MEPDLYQGLKNQIGATITSTQCLPACAPSGEWMFAWLWNPAPNPDTYTCPMSLSQAG